jgi:hypothetical protein
MRCLRNILVTVLIVGVLVSLCACGPSSKLVGKWVATKSSYNLPASMVFNRDGTGSVDGFRCEWEERDGKLILNIPDLYRKEKSYTYEFKDSKLYLNGKYEYKEK